MDKLPEKRKYNDILIPPVDLGLLDWWRSMGMKSIRDQQPELRSKFFMEPNIEPTIPLQPYQWMFLPRDTISFEPEEQEQVLEPKRRR